MRESHAQCVRLSRSALRDQGRGGSLVSCPDPFPEVKKGLKAAFRSIKSLSSSQYYYPISYPLSLNMTKYHKIYKAILPVEGNMQLLPFASSVQHKIFLHHLPFVLQPYQVICMGLGEKTASCIQNCHFQRWLANVHQQFTFN